MPDGNRKIAIAARGAILMFGALGAIRSGDGARD